MKIYWREELFNFPVVYDDGLISRRKKDLAGRKPLGIVFEGVIIFLFDEEKMIEPREAESYCESFTVFGLSCNLPSWHLLNEIKREKDNINSLLIELGGVPFANDWYLCQGYRQDTEYSCIHLVYPSVAVYCPEPESMMRVRHVFYLPL